MIDGVYYDAKGNLLDIIPDEEAVNHPKHYKLDGLDIEAIDVIKSVLGAEKFQGYCRGNVLKYLIRAENKNGVEDLKKAKVYLEWEIESNEKEHIEN